MNDYALFDFTPLCCPDCGEDFDLEDFAKWFDFRKGSEHICPYCDLVIYFVRDLETIIRRIEDAKLD